MAQRTGDLQFRGLRLPSDAGPHKLDRTLGRRNLAPGVAAESKPPEFRAVDLDGPVDLAGARPYEDKVCGIPAIARYVGGTPDDQRGPPPSRNSSEAACSGSCPSGQSPLRSGM